MKIIAPLWPLCIAGSLAGSSVAQTDDRSREQPRIIIDVSVVEPGMAVLQHEGRAEARWLEPADFLEQPKVTGWLRGTRRATRAATLKAHDLENPVRVPDLAWRPENVRVWNSDKWANDYRSQTFSGFDPERDAVAHAKRSPLRILRYRVSDEQPGSRPEIIAVCYSLEELLFVLSTAYWDYFDIKQDGGRGERLTPPGFLVGTSEDTVLSWLVATDPETPHSERRRALRYMPRFAPFWIAQLPCESVKGSAVSKHLFDHPTESGAFYDMIGWNVRREDFTELVDLLKGSVLSRAVTDRGDARWNKERRWSLDRQRKFPDVFNAANLKGSIVQRPLPKKFLGPKYKEDRSPYEAYRRAHKK